MLFEDECRRLLEEASHDSRSYLLVLLVLEAGLKREELLKLRLTDFDTANPYRPELWVRPGKRYKARQLRLPPEVPAVLAAYTAEYRPQEILFDCCERNLRYILKQVAERAGIAKRVSCQSLRDTFAVRQLRAGETIERELEKLVVLQTAIDGQGWPQAAPSYTPRSLRRSTRPGAWEP